MLQDTCVRRGHMQGDEARLNLTGGPASSSASESFLAYTPTSTLAITASSLTPQSVTGSVAGPLALTPVRRMDLHHEGACCSMAAVAVLCGDGRDPLSYVSPKHVTDVRQQLCNVAAARN